MAAYEYTALDASGRELKGVLVGAATLMVITTLRLGHVLLPVLLAGVWVAVLAAWREQRTSTSGPWPAVAAGGAYVATVLVGLWWMVTREVARLVGAE